MEQPIAMDDLDALEFVTRTVQTPILADEAVWTTRDLTEVLRRRQLTTGAPQQFGVGSANSSRGNRLVATVDVLVRGACARAERRIERRWEPR